MDYSLELLGQSGCLIKGEGRAICIDPYLSNSVQELDAPDLKRLTPIPHKPDELCDLDWVLITHEHIDHCDPHTLPLIAKASPHCHFLGPISVTNILKGWDIEEKRIHLCKEGSFKLTDTIQVQTVPAAHPTIERDKSGNLRAVGYVLDLSGFIIYIAGDTGLTSEVVESLRTFHKIDLALLPVNEQNFYRHKRGIIGNMSIRDAFNLAEDLSIIKVIPVHWDMFEVNSVTPEEIQAVYEAMQPNFELCMDRQIKLNLNSTKRVSIL